MKILVDTDVLIDYSKAKSGDLGALLERSESGEVELFICPVNVAEFLNDRKLKTSNSMRLKARNFLKLFKLVKLGMETGEITARILLNVDGIYLGDALIAAACIENDLHLLTRNQKHFSRINGLKFYPVETKRKSG